MEVDCIDRLELELERLSLSLVNGYNDLKSIFDYIKRYDVQPEYITFLLNISKLTHNDEFVACVSGHRKNAKYFNIMKIFHIVEPDEKSTMITNYLKLGFSHNFISKVLLYPSGRPVVDLSKFILMLGIKPKTYIHKPPNTINSQTYICELGDGVYNQLYIPVLRYQIGMSGYITAAPSSESFCGTFYYYDPSSEFLLQSGKMLVSWNKITACLDLGIDINTIHSILYEAVKNWTIVDDNDNLHPYIPSIYGYDVNPQLNIKEQWYEVVQLYWDRLTDPTIHHPNMYAKEDGLDQMLCVKGFSMGIDTIILKYMTGETRVVSEVLDTRSRIDSFSNISVPQ